MIEILQKKANNFSTTHISMSIEVVLDVRRSEFFFQMASNIAVANTDHPVSFFCGKIILILTLYTNVCLILMSSILYSY